jgi:hypothetical protein
MVLNCVKKWMNNKNEEKRAEKARAKATYLANAVNYSHKSCKLLALGANVINILQ